MQKNLLAQGKGAKAFETFFAIISVSLTLAMTVLGGSIVNVALPALAHKFSISAYSAIWIVNAFQFALLVSLLAFSSMGEIYGYKKVFLGGCLLFTLSSVFCALSSSFGMLIVARAVQGISAAAIAGVNFAQLKEIYSKEKFALGLGINAMVVSVAAASGPSISSLILSYLSWEWLFLVNIPLGVLAVAFGVFFLPNSKRDESKKFDVFGAFANAAILAILVYAVDSCAHGGYTLTVILAIALVVLGFLFVRRELNMDSPILPVDLFSIPIFAVSVLASVCSFMAQVLVIVSMPFTLHDLCLKDSGRIGLLMTPWPLAVFCIAPFSGYLFSKFGAPTLGFAGMMIFSVSAFLLSFIDANTPDLYIALLIAACGLANGLFQPPNNATIMLAAPKNRSGGASGTVATARLLGQTLGASITAIAFMLDPKFGGLVSSKLAAIIALITAIVSLFRAGNFKLRRP